MDWNQITALPALWVPFKSLPFALFAVVAVPMLLAWIISYAMFKRRVGGVYFAIITQAVALILTVLIIGQQGYTGGVNGMTDLKTMAGWDTRTDSAKIILYYVCVALLVGAIVLCRWMQTSKFGTLLLAMRDKEDRVRFSGYDVSNFKVFVFCLAAGAVGHRRGAVLAAGGLHVAQLRGHRAVDRDGDLRRRRRAHEPGRRGLRHAAGERRQDLFLRELPRPWLFLMAGLFIGVTMAFPMGLAGVWESHVRPLVERPPGRPARRQRPCTRHAGGGAAATGTRAAASGAGRRPAAAQGRQRPARLKDRPP
jgi:urea transport system permease protein